MAKRDLFRKHADTIGKAADSGAVAAGYGWWYFLGVFALILLVAWAVAIWIGSWIALAVAAGVTLSIVPPLAKEWKRRDEVRTTMGRPSKR
jgi:hypothetical protein